MVTLNKKPDYLLLLYHGFLLLVDCVLHFAELLLLLLQLVLFILELRIQASKLTLKLQPEGRHV